MHWKNDWAGFFIVYFKWCYYLCVTPFRLTWVEKEKAFRLDSNWFQKFSCALMYFLLGLWYLKDMRRIPVDDLKRNPVVYFSLAFNMEALYYHNFLLIVMFWRRQERFLALVNFDCDGYAGSTLKKRIFAELLCSIFAILALGYSLSGYRVVKDVGPDHLSMMFRCLVVDGRFAFFLTRSMDPDVPCNNGNPPFLDELSPLDILVGVLAFLMEAARQIVGFFSDFFPLICCISLWTCTGSIRKVLEDDVDDDNDNGRDHEVGKTSKDPSEVYPPYNNIYFNFHRRFSLMDIQGKSVGIILPQLGPNHHHQTKVTSAPIPPPPPTTQDEKKAVPEGTVVVMNESSSSSGGGNGPAALKGNVLLERYEICKAFSKRVNRALGELLFVYVLSSIMYLSTCMDAVLVLEDWFGKLRVAFFFFVFILMFFIGSEIVNKVYGVREWLSDPLNNTFLPEKNLLVLINEVTCHSIGVSGNGMFTVTYSTFMTVMTTTVTFFIIILQFQKQKPVRDDDDGDVIPPNLMPFIEALLQKAIVAGNYTI